MVRGGDNARRGQDASGGRARASMLARRGVLRGARRDVLSDVCPPCILLSRSRRSQLIIAWSNLAGICARCSPVMARKKKARTEPEWPPAQGRKSCLPTRCPHNKLGGPLDFSLRQA